MKMRSRFLSFLLSVIISISYVDIVLSGGLVRVIRYSSSVITGGNRSNRICGIWYRVKLEAFFSHVTEVKL